MFRIKIFGKLLYFWSVQREFEKRTVETKIKMPRFCQHCGVDAPNAGQCGDVAGARHLFIEEIASGTGETIYCLSGSFFNLLFSVVPIYIISRMRLNKYFSYLIYNVI